MVIRPGYHQDKEPFLHSGPTLLGTEYLRKVLFNFFLSPNLVPLISNDLIHPLLIAQQLFHVDFIQFNISHLVNFLLFENYKLLLKSTRLYLADIFLGTINFEPDHRQISSQVVLKRELYVWCSIEINVQLMHPSMLSGYLD